MILETGRVDFNRVTTQEEIRFGGKIMTIVAPGDRYYASVERPGTLDEILYYLMQGL
jgi:hypothetical protein